MCIILQNAHGLTWSNQHRQGQGQQVTPTLRALQLRADGSGLHVLLAAGSHTAIILSPQGHALDLLTLPVSFLSSRLWLVRFAQLAHQNLYVYAFMLMLIYSVSILITWRVPLCRLSPGMYALHFLSMQETWLTVSTTFYSCQHAILTGRGTVW